VREVEARGASEVGGAARRREGGGGTGARVRWAVRCGRGDTREVEAWRREGGRATVALARWRRGARNEERHDASDGGTVRCKRR
jgi:hypothetical protein